MPGMLVTAKQEEAVLNGLIEQGAQVRTTKRGFMVAFPNGQSGVISLQGDYRRLLNARGMVRRNGLTWPLDTTKEKEDTMTTTTLTRTAYRTEYPDYLKPMPRPEIVGAVKAYTASRKHVTLPALAKATGFSTNPVSQALLRQGWLQEVPPAGTPTTTSRTWSKAPSDVAALLTFTGDRQLTGRAATGKTEEELKAEREARRYERSEYDKAHPPFTPLDQVAAVPVVPRSPKEEQRNGPVTVTKMTDREAAEALGLDISEPVNPEMTAEPIILESVMPDTMSAKAEAEEAMQLAEQAEARAVAAEQKIADMEALAVEREKEHQRQLDYVRAEHMDALGQQQQVIGQLQREKSELTVALARAEEELEKERALMEVAQAPEPVLTADDSWSITPQPGQSIETLIEYGKVMGLTVELRARRA